MLLRRQEGRNCFLTRSVVAHAASAQLCGINHDVHETLRDPRGPHHHLHARGRLPAHEGQAAAAETRLSPRPDRAHERHPDEAAPSGVTLKVIAGLTRPAGIMNLFDLPGPVRAAMVFVLFDIWMYYWHMANHRSAFLWRFHRAHHADTEMDTTTALRFHPGELVLSAFARLPVILLIGMSFSELAFLRSF